MRFGSALRILVGGLAILAGTGSASFASCVAPSIGLAGREDDRTIRVAPGETLHVVGRYWTAECNDTGSGSTGCIFGGSDGSPRPQEPMRDVSIELRPGMNENYANADTSVVLVEGIDPDRKLRFTRVIRLPEGLDPGSYRLEANSGTYTTAEPLILVVR